MKAMDHGAAALLHARAGHPASTGMDALPLHAQALVTELQPARDAQEHGVLLRLLEIGFLPGETVRVVARGGVGGDPIAVRVGQATFALRHQEASMVRVVPSAQAERGAE